MSSKPKKNDIYCIIIFVTVHPCSDSLAYIPQIKPKSNIQLFADDLWKITIH